MNESKNNKSDSSEKKLKLLIVDDDNTQIQRIKAILKDIDYPEVSCRTAESAEEALTIIGSSVIELVLSDYRLPGMNGLELLKEIKKINPLIGVVIMTAFENVKDAVEILQNGGDDYLIKPTGKSQIEHVLIRFYEKLSIYRENESVNRETRASFEHLPLVFGSTEMQNVLNLVARTSDSDATTLITGESGTGKELIARLIHNSGKRKDFPFVTVNIAALPETLMESELFGHAKGSFTGADSDRIGRFEEADKGTLFIDEVGDIPPSIQVKLLRAIQFGYVQRVGENRERKFNVRIIAATNRNLEQLIREKKFRDDLYWRLNVIRITIPPLRERKKDITALVSHFIEKYNKKNSRNIRGISNDAMDLIMKHSFPGNVRELENMIERSVIMSRGTIITRRDISEIQYVEEPCREISIENYDIKMKNFESRFLLEALREAEWNQSRAARLIGITERKLRSRIGILGIKKDNTN